MRSWPGLTWSAVIRAFEPPTDIEFEVLQAVDSWAGSRVSFHLEPSGRLTNLRLAHTGWRRDSESFRTSSYSWAMYLRVLRRYLESGQTVNHRLLP